MKKEIPASNNMSQIIFSKIEERLNNARQLYQKGEVENSISEYNQVVFLKSDHADAYKEMADIYALNFDYTMAVLLYKKSISLSKSIVAQEKMKNLLIKRGLMLVEQGEPNYYLSDQLYEPFKPFLTINMKDIELISQQNMAYLNKKQISNNNKNVEEQKQQQGPGSGSQDTGGTASSANYAKHIKSHQAYVNAVAYSMTNHFNYALDELEIAIQNNPQYIKPYLLQGKILWSLNKQALGNEMMWKAENLNSEDPQVKVFLSIIVPLADQLLKETRYLLVQNNIEKCNYNIQKGLELFPNNTQFLLIQAFIHRKENEFESSLNILLQAYHSIRDQSVETQVKSQIALTYNEMGMVLYRRGQFDEAITLFNQSLSFKPHDWGVLVNRGDCHRQLDKIDEAIKDYVKAQKYGGQKAEILSRLSISKHSIAIALFNNQQYTQALREFNQTIQIYPKIANYFLNRGKCHLQLEHYHQAIEDFKSGLQIDPNNYEIASLVKKTTQDQAPVKKQNVIYINQDDY